MIRAIFGDRPGIFLTCLFAWTLTNMDQALFGFAVPGMLAEFGLSLQAVGLILTMSFAAAALLVIPAGIAADRFGRGTTLCVLLAVSAVMVGLQGFARERGGVVPGDAADRDRAGEAGTGQIARRPAAAYPARGGAAGEKVVKRRVVGLYDARLGIDLQPALFVASNFPPGFKFYTMPMVWRVTTGVRF